jgi:two-component system, NarL family, sensor histidine kinase UhpB
MTFPLYQMKWLTVAFLGFSLPGCLFAQAKHTTADSARVFSCLSKVDMFTDRSQFDSAMHFAQLALSESIKLKMPRGEAHAHLKIADVIYETGKMVDHPKHDSAALQIALHLKDTFLIALSFYHLGQYFLDLKKLNEAEQLFQQSLRLRFEKDQSEYTAVVYNDLGFLNGERGLFDKQVDWNLKAIRLYQKNKNDFGEAQSLSNLSTTYLEVGKKQEAFAYAKQALAIREKIGSLSGMALSCNNISQMYLLSDSLEPAIKYQEQGLKYAEQSGLRTRMAQSYVSMALLLNRQKKIEEAFRYEKKAIAIYQEIDQAVLANRYIAAAFYSNKLNDSAGAVDYFSKSEKLARSLGIKPVLRNVYSFLSDFYKNRKDYVLAYDYYKKYILYRDSLLNTETNVKIAALEAQFDTEKKDFEISRLSNDQKIKQLAIEKQRAIITGNTAEALRKQNEINLLFKSSELKEQFLSKQAIELDKQMLMARNNQQKLELAEKERLLQQKQISNQKLARNFLLGGLALVLLLGYLAFNRFQLKKKLEQQASLLTMRNSISQNLHDDIGASLSNINILTELAKRNVGIPSKSSEYLDKASEDIQRISESLSDIVWNINPRYDDLQNLFVRMKRYASDMFDGKNIRYTMEFPEPGSDISLSMDKRRDFYLIFKEAVNNLVKYSQASEAEVKVEAKNNQLLLLVADNGVGFDNNHLSSGNGVHNMKLRAEKWNAPVTIISAPGKGTTINLAMQTG